MRVVVTGSRHVRDKIPVWGELEMLRDCGMIKVAQGGARGADKHALSWAVANDFPYKTYKVDEMIDGRWPAAGPRRNARMLDCFKPDLVLAFPQPGSRGTWDCIKAAASRGIRVIIVPLGKDA